MRPPQRPSTRAWVRRLAAVVGACVTTSLLVATGATAAGAQQADPAQELAERYAPVMVLKAQDAPCDTDGEAYEPISVEAVLDNPQVLLRQVGAGNPVVMRGPSAADLYGLGEGFYLDFPGEARTPGCVYEQDDRRFTEGLEPTVYAHVIEGADSGSLVLQYWFYWYFNDWNNKHESDWEGISLLFDVATIEEALATSPTRVGYAQHEGGEGADWGSGKLERRDTHPVVYSSSGSHASYYGAALHLGRSAQEGFGCDTTDSPSREVRPAVVVLPDEAAGPEAPFAWLGFDGRWGERNSGAFNGPTGPATKPRWSDPLPWFDDLRADSVVVPAGDRSGAQVVRTFCTVVETGSNVLIGVTTSPGRVLLVLAVIVGVVGFVARRTRWDAVDPLPVRQRRRFGQILRTSPTLYWRHRRTFALMGVAYVPLVLLAGLLVALARHVPVFGPMLEAAGDRSGTGVITALLFGALPNLIAYIIVNAAVAHATTRLEADAAEGPVAAYRAVAARARDLATGLGRAIVTVVLLTVTVVGIPWAIWELVRYQFVAQVTMLEGASGRASLRRSGELVHGRWFHTAFVVALVNTTVVVVGTTIGLVVLLLVRGLPLWAFSGVVSIVFAALVPLGAIAITLLYGDAVTEEEDSDDEDEAVPPALADA